MDGEDVYAAEAVLTAREACRYICISRPTLVRLITDGKIRAQRIGREWRILRAEIDRFLRGGWSSTPAALELVGAAERLDFELVRGSDGRLRAINPEAGFFGVVPGTSPKTNRNAYEMIHHDTIYTNVAVTQDNQPWWEGRIAGTPAIDWQGRPYDKANGPAAHPNSRFTVSAKQNPAYNHLMEHPDPFWDEFPNLKPELQGKIPSTFSILARKP